MKMKRFFTALAAVLLFVPLTQAQTEADALRYSWINFGGTSRSMSMGGAFGALGGDASTLSVNPAGIGVYRKSEFTFSLGFDRIATTASLGDITTDESEPSLNIPNFGLVGVYDGKDGSPWQKLQFGLAYNRLATYHSDYQIRGNNDSTSLLDVFVDEAVGTDPNELASNFPFTSGLAWNTWLIDSADGTGSQYFHEMYFGDKEQIKDIHSWGRSGETVITLGGNLDDRLYIGGTIGFPGVRYTQESTYREESLADTVLAVESFEYTETIRTRGSGFNFKVGIIGRPSDFMRIGLAYHSPTWLSLTDVWSTTMTSNFRPGTGFSAEYTDASPSGSYDYRMTTPARAIGSLAFILGRMGVISADYEVINYSKARLNSSSAANFTGNGYSFINENAQIEQQFRSTQNIRLGAEFRLAPLRLRAGYAIYGNPYVDEATVSDPTTTFITGGVGFRAKSYFIDFGYSRAERNTDYYLYDPALVDPANINQAVSRFVFTVGFRY